MDARKGRLQNPRNFTVQIRDCQTDQIVGTGIIVSQDGKVLTCAHVVRDAGVDPRTSRPRRNPFKWVMYKIASLLSAMKTRADEGEISVYFAGPDTKHKTQWRARVSAHFEAEEDDIVMLEPVDERPPLLRQHVAILGDARQSHRHDFCSYGYYQRGDRPSGSATGEIGMSIEKLPNEILRSEWVELMPKVAFGEGMSGAGVLDCNTDRNVVVGLCSQIHRADKMAWAVNAWVVSLSPFDLQICESNPMDPPQELNVDPDDVVMFAVANPGIQLKGAGPLIEEWVGRESLLKSLQEIWEDGSCRAVGLIGFGGEGKSSLVRRWLHLLENSSGEKPAGIFWWNFRWQPSEELFLESLLLFLSGNNIELARTYTSVSARVDVIGAMLPKARCVFVLDSLETMQHFGGDRHGTIKSEALVKLLEWLAETIHASVSILTSRVPLVDMISMPNYREQTVTRLTSDEGVTLLRKLGTTSASPELASVVDAWEGHALKLTLVGKLAVERGVDPREIGSTQTGPGQDEFQDLSGILRDYDDHLSDVDRKLIVVCSAFRGEIPIAALAQILGFENESPTESIQLLVNISLVRRTVEGVLEMHVLVRDYYRQQFDVLPKNEARDFHGRIAAFFNSQLRESIFMVDLEPRIESIYHLCQAANYEQAIRLVKPITEDSIHYSGKIEMLLDVLRNFFPDGDFSGAPLVSGPQALYLVNNELATAMMAGGHVKQAVKFLERAIAVCEGNQWRSAASVSYENLASAFIFLGRLDEALKAGDRALDYATDKNQLSSAHCRRGYANSLRGDVAQATADYSMARDESRFGLETFLNGAQYARFQMRYGDLEIARRLVEFNLPTLESLGGKPLIPAYEIIAAELSALDGDKKKAREHFDAAITLARQNTRVDILTDALVSRGLFLAHQFGKASFSDQAENVVRASRDLNEAVKLAENGDYRLSEIEARIGLFFVYNANEQVDSAISEFERAKQLVEFTGYGHGQLLLERAQANQSASADSADSC